MTSPQMSEEPEFYEKILHDVDSYWDDLGAHLAISRVVNDAVFKGVVNSISEKAAVEVALKDADLQELRDRLKSYECSAIKYNKQNTPFMIPEETFKEVQTQGIRSDSHISIMEEDVESDCRELLLKLQFTVEGQLHRLARDTSNANERLVKIDERTDASRTTLSQVFSQITDMCCSLKVTTDERQWEYEFQKELCVMMFQSHIKDILNDFAEKLHEQKKPFNMLSGIWQESVDKLSFILQELDIISKQLLSLEHSFLHLESEDWNSGKRKDHLPRKLSANYPLLPLPHPDDHWASLMDLGEDSPKPVLDSVEPPELKSMCREEVISYYKSEMTKMRRQHDSALQEKTEALFRLKREFLKEMGSLPSRRDKEIENLRKKLPEITSKLEDVLLHSKMLPTAQYNDEEICNLKDRIDVLFFENQHLRALLKDKNREVMSLSSKVSKAATEVLYNSYEEASLFKQIDKLKWDIECMKVESAFKDELYNDILRGYVHEHESLVKDLELQAKVVEEISLIVLRGMSQSAIATLDHAIVKNQAALHEKERTLGLQLEEREMLNQKIASLMSEREILASESGSTLNEQKKQFDLVCEELDILRDKLSKREILIVEKERELDLSKGQLDETLKQIEQYEENISSLNSKNDVLCERLEEAEKENNMLHGILETKKMLISQSPEGKNQGEDLESIVTPITELSSRIADFENRLTHSFEQYGQRLKSLSFHCKKLEQGTSMLDKRGFLYKQMLDIKCSNLQKAEAEVDLLGDEVDSLLNLLGKIYITLDHYSPILQHYPGVMEILKLVKRELKGENNGHI